jgi:HEAT repeat protein
MTPEQIAERLAMPTSAERRQAAEAAMILGESMGAAAAALAAHSGDSDVGEPCIAALEKLGPPPVESLPALQELLSGDEMPAYWAATLIGRLGADGAPAAPQLITTATGAQPLAVRERAVWALGKIGPAAKEALPALDTLSKSTQPRLARLAKQSAESIQG